MGVFRNGFFGIKLHYVFFIAFTCSCSSKVVYEGIDCNNMYTCDVKILNDGMILNDVHLLGVYDSLLVIYDFDGVFVVLNKYTGEIIDTIGGKGRGPGEYVQVSDFTIDDEQSLLYIYDESKRSLVIHGFDSLGKGNTFVKEIVIDIDSLRSFSRLDHLHGGSFLCNSFFVRFLTTDLKDVYSSYNDFAFRVSNNDHDNIRLYSFYSSYGICPNKKRIASVSLIGGIVEVFNIDEGKIKLSKVRHFIEPIFDKEMKGETMEIKPNINTIYGFRRVCTTDNYFYSQVFNSTEPKELSTILCRFDWDGNIVGMYDCGYPINNMYADSDDIIYITIYKDEEEVFAVMDLNGARKI